MSQPHPLSSASIRRSAPGPTSHFMKETPTGDEGQRDKRYSPPPRKARLSSEALPRLQRRQPIQISVNLLSKPREVPPSALTAASGLSDPGLQRLQARQSGSPQLRRWVPISHHPKSCSSHLLSSPCGGSSTPAWQPQGCVTQISLRVVKALLGPHLVLLGSCAGCLVSIGMARGGSGRLCSYAGLWLLTTKFPGYPPPKK